MTNSMAPRNSFSPNACIAQVLTSLLLPVLFLSTVLAAETRAADKPKQWRVIWTDEPQSRAVVCWNTDTPGKKHRVSYDKRSRKGKIKDYKKTLSCTKNGAYSKDLYYHHAQLKGLEPGTTYYFVMASDDAVSQEFHFITAPAKDTAFKIIFGGDSRSGVKERRKMNQRIAALAAADKSILAFAHGGDYVKSGTNLGQWTVWMADHELTVTPERRMIPLIPARGNHESRGPIYDQVLAFPGGQGKNYFASRLSPEVLFVTLNTETKADGAQKQFLESTLRKGKGCRWRVAQYHCPAYPAVKGAGVSLKHWVPLFEKYNVALACEADGHCIKRTVPIRKGKFDPTGVVYIGEGGLGVHQRKPKTDRWYVKKPGMASHGHHVQLLSFSNESLKIEVIGMDGKVLDSHSIARRRKK